MNHSSPAVAAVSMKKSILIYFFVSLFLVFEMAVQVSPSVMASELMRDLNIDTLVLGIMSGVYFYTYTAMQLPSGLLFDRFKPRSIIACSVTVCALGALLFGVADNLYLACFARLLMGLGSAFAFVSVLVVAADLFAAKYFALLTGITQMLAALGAFSGQLPISYLVNSLGWQRTMMLLGITGLVLAVIIFCLLNYRQTPKQNTQQSESWVAHVKKDLALIVRNKQNWFVAMYACLLWVPMSGFASLWGVPFLMHADHLSANHAAFASSMMWIGLAVGSPLLGAFSSMVKNKVTALRLSAVIGVVSFAAVLWLPLSLTGLVVALFIAGAACAGQAISFAVVRQNNNPAVRSTAIAFNNMAVVISGALFQPIIGSLIQYYQPHGLALAYHHGCSLIFMAYVLGLVAAVFFIREKSAAFAMHQRGQVAEL